MKYFFAFIVVCLVVYVGWLFAGKYQVEESERLRLEQIVNQENTDIIHDETWPFNISNINEIESVLKLKNSIVSFNEGDKILQQLFRFKKIVDAGDKKDYSKVYELSSKAYMRYEASKQHLDSIKYNGDAEFNYTLNYIKGCVNFRMLKYYSNPSTAQEYFNNSFDAFKNALKFKPDDPHAILNIELLLRKNKEMNQQSKSDKLGDEPGKLKSPNFGVKKPKGQF